MVQDTRLIVQIYWNASKYSTSHGLGLFQFRLRVMAEWRVMGEKWCMEMHNEGVASTQLRVWL